MAARRPTTPVRPRAGTSSSPARRRPPAGGAGQPPRAPGRSARPARPTDAAGGTARDAADQPRTVRLARGLSVRAVVFGLVVLSAFALLFPSVRAYLAQRAELDRMIAEVAAAEQTEAELRAELERWDDPAFVQAQARDRLLFVMPGETAYRVIDPETVVEAPVLDGGATPESGPTLPFGGSVMPWYTTIWESVQIAGSYDPEAVTGTPSDDPAGDRPGTQDDPETQTAPDGDAEEDG